MKLRFEVIPTSGMWLTTKERVMERRTFLILAAGALLTGCDSPDAKRPVKKPLCDKCGQIKGSKLCCKPGAEKCPKCKKDKGLPGCCMTKTPEKTPEKTPAKTPAKAPK